MSDDTAPFAGFDEPTANYSKLPHAMIDALPQVETVGEMKVILYILRHTWGFQDDQKRITIDEFQNGRKRRDGTRLDSGTGLNRGTIMDGLKRAEAHGFIGVEVDDRDLGRIKKYYRLRMRGDEGAEDHTPEPEKHTAEVQKLDPRGMKTIPRSEKETVEKETKGKTTPPAAEKSRLKDPLAVTGERGWGQKGKSWTVPAAAGGADGWDAAVDAFAGLVGIAPAVVNGKERGQWSRQLQKVASDWGATASDLLAVIEAVPRSQFHWKTWGNPWSAARDLGTLLGQHLSGGIVEAGEGKNDGFDEALAEMRGGKTVDADGWAVAA
jgi:DNA-binding PadR family transcriptional regulator